MSSAELRAGRPQRLAALAWLVFAVLWGAWIRIDTTLSDPNFDAHDARGLLRSDPALLAYLTQEIDASLAAGRPWPQDFGADPRIQHPYTTDVPREFPVGQEFLIAWADGLQRHWLATPVPLHVVALVVMSLLASSFLVGVFLGVRALTASAAWASLAVLLALLSPANYRTIGFLWVGEDIALPFFALHVGLLLQAARTGRGREYLMSGLAAAAALATWHASSFVLTLELAALVAGAFWSRRSPFEARGAWLALAPVLLAGVAVPVLRASGFLLSPAAALLLALAAPAVGLRFPALAFLRTRLGIALVLLAGVLGLGALAPDAYRHVHEVVLAKLRFLGRFPDDPAALSFDARLLWQGPFETLPPADLVAWCGWPLVLLAAGALVALLRRDARASERFAGGLLLVALPAAWMFARLVVLVGILAPVAVATLAGLRRRRLALAVCGTLTLAQAGSFASFVSEHRIDWYLPPRARHELVALLEFVDANVPPDEAIACDFVNSPALFVHTRHPIVLQPKYETDRSRRQAEAFLTTFFQGSRAELATLMRERFRCRYLLVDRYVLWELSRVTAGLRADERAPRAGAAAEEFLSSDDGVLRAIEGFELLYRSPPGIEGADYRLFRLRE